MKNVFAALVLSGLFAFSFAQERDERVLMTIADDNITVDEFLGIYNKNNTNNVVDKKTVEEYVDLFVNFKLKVKEAESLGKDTAEKFVKELAGYRRQLARPYLVDKEMTQQLINEAYARMQEDIKAYHILVRVDENASAADTVKALKQLKALSKGVKSEAQMVKAIETVQKDNNEATIGEDLGYFTAFSMVYPFETRAYNTEVGTLSKPVRTRFGYHVIFVVDRRPARGEIRVSHIMTKSAENSEKDESMQAKEKIDEIYSLLKSGGNFKDLAKQYSEDQGTANKGGILPWFGTGRMVPEFEDAAFGLTLNGEYTEPIKTAYGWHIIKREDYRGIGSLEEVESTIKQKIERDTRGTKGRSSLIAKLKNDYSITFNYKNRDAVHKNVNNDFLAGKWNPKNEETSDAPVITITDNKYSGRTVKFTKADYFEYLKQNQPRRSTETLLSRVLSEQWKAFEEQSIIEFEDSNLEAKYPAFKALMQEYHDGILLFDLMDEKVWSKAVKDTAGLRSYYEMHKDDFMWDDRVKATVYTCANEKIAKQTKKLIKKAEKKGYSHSDIEKMVNESNALNLNIESEIFLKGENTYVDASPWIKGMYEATNENGQVMLIEVEEVYEPMPKKLNETRGLVTSAYQSELEQNWIKELRSKYTFKVDQKVLNSIK